MRLSTGTRLGPYDVVGALGSGGMGEVYRARDGRLGREVAIKVLPASVADNPDRLRRFEQEARATAALNHPNILSVFDIGQHEGQPYVVSELLDGHDLRVELARGAVPAKRAIDWVGQVCQGLAAAHEKAIVHRDLKPENLFLTRDGRIKILDFGLAKLVDVVDDGASQTATRATVPGLVLGTAAYMSPEQVRGQATDHRSDIFSVGVVLYELLAGKGAFRAASAVETMDARPLGLSDAHLFAISSGGELAIGLNAFLGAIPGMGPRGTLAGVPLAGGAPRVVLADVEDADWHPGGDALAVSHVVDGVTRLEYPIGTVLYQTDGWIDSLRFSPAGDRLAFAEHPLRGDDRGSVAVVDLSGMKTVLASGFGQVDGVAWRDNDVWFCASAGFSADTLFAVTLAGKSRVLFRAPVGCFLRDISSDGRVLIDNYVSRNEMVWRQERDPIVERSLTWLSDSFPADLGSDQQTLLFTEPALGANYQVALRKTDGSEVVRLGEGEAEALSSDGKWVLTTMLTTPPALVLIPTGAGEVVRLPQVGLDYKRFSQWFPGTERILFAASEAGHGTRLWVQRVFPPDKPRAITGEGVSIRGESISPDGSTVAAIGTDGKLGLFPVDGGAARPIAGAEVGEQLTRWSPDGRRLLVYTSSVPSTISTIDLASGRRERLRVFRPTDATGATFMYAILLTADTRAGVYSFQRTESNLRMVEGLR